MPQTIQPASLFSLTPRQERCFCEALRLLTLSLELTQATFQTPVEVLQKSIDSLIERNAEPTQSSPSMPFQIKLAPLRTFLGELRVEGQQNAQRLAAIQQQVSLALETSYLRSADKGQTSDVTPAAIAGVTRKD